MNTKIEDLSLRLINAYSNNNEYEVARYRFELLVGIEMSDLKNQITLISHYYLVSKALFYAIKTPLQNQKIASVFYYCLLKGTSEEERAIREGRKSDRDLAAISVLAFTFLVENNQLVGDAILCPLMDGNRDYAVRTFISQAGYFYWNYMNASVNVALEEELRLRFDAAAEYNSGVKGIAEETKVLMKQFVDTTLDALIYGLECQILYS
ncbi:hypothetical protein [Phocaeicola salanitronis]|uniref:hypothetical protein n=1 Tax=Phocaeicola salanitronis TaxID=376805 RepID=UPI0023FA19C6|nr:hypothetical protein [Phocaeicola salanitronis]